MQKTLTAAQIREIGGLLFTNWEKDKVEIKLSGKSLYSLIALKKTLEQKLTIIEETLAALALQHNGAAQADGSIFIPQEDRAAANQAFMEMGNEDLEIEYDEIILTANDILPVNLCEALFDFIIFEKE